MTQPAIKPDLDGKGVFLTWGDFGTLIAAANQQLREARARLDGFKANPGDEFYVGLCSDTIRDLEQALKALGVPSP